MYKRIDTDSDDIEGFSYENMDGDIEIISIQGDLVNFIYEGNVNHFSAVYVEDIPKFVKALEAAYNHCKAKE